jgi:Na+/H+ antiporter NhaC
MEYGILSIIIPILTIVLAIITKDVIVSLLGGIFAGLLVINAYDPLAASAGLFNGIIEQFSHGWITKTLLFTLFVGSIIHLLNQSGAVKSFVAYIDTKASRIDSPVGAQMLAYVVGIVIFIESSITSLVAGTVAKPLCDRNGISRAKLAYICDSTSAPVCSLIPLNAWGALLLGLIVSAVDGKVIEGDGISLLIASIPYNFYAIFTLLIVLAVIFKKWEIGPMKTALISTVATETSSESAPPALMPMLLPIIVMVAAVPAGLVITGKGDLFKGSGSTSVYYATIVTLFVMYLCYLATKRLNHRTFLDGTFRGMGEMLPIAAIMLLAIFIGKVIGDLGTAKYLSSLLQGNISPALMPMLIFLTASITAFATGTSWGTFSIMMPIALALAAAMHLDIPLTIAAVISGGIFGDHASPISDTTIISSMAAGCDHVEHVRTQLPYALIGGGLAALAFLVRGM